MSSIPFDTTVTAADAVILTDPSQGGTFKRATVSDVIGGTAATTLIDARADVRIAATGPTRAVADADTVSLWSLDGVLTDAGTAAEVQVVTGTAVYVPGPTGGRAFSAATGDMAAANNVLHEITTAFTLSFWFRVSAYEAGAVTVLCMGGGTDDEANNILYGVEIGTAGELAFKSENGAGTDDDIATGVSIPLHEWVYVTFTKDATTGVNTYLNGSLVDTDTVTQTTGGTTSVFQIGREEDGTAVTGTAFADVQLRDIEQTAAQVAAQYRSLVG